jgi:DNA-directed RNA polymerase II subunit RPB2
MDNQTLWKIIHSHFEDNYQSLVRHHIDSYNDFYKNGFFQIFKEKNPVTINSVYDESIQDFRHQCIMYFGGKNADKIYFGKPVIYDGDENTHYMFPNEARLRNMTYGMTIHYDIEIEFIDILEPGQEPYDIILSNGGFIDEGAYTETKKENFKEGRKNDKLVKGGGEGDDGTVDADEGKKEDDEEDPIELMEGGGPKKVERKKRVKSTEVEMTTGMATEMREIMEKSLSGKNVQKRTMVLEKIYLGKFPIMLQSSFCILNGLPRQARFNMGECKNDLGGYFIIDGKEKTIICQEKFADNMLYIRNIDDDTYSYSAEIKSVSENATKTIRTLSVRMMKPTSKYTFENIVVNIPNVRKPVPLFIVFRALGIISDKDIITYCLLDLEKYESMVDLFIPSVHDSATIMTQTLALRYISSLTKYGTVSYALEILTDYFLPHIGEVNYIQKAYYLGHIVFRLLCVKQGLEQPTDRDNFKYKRVELVGTLLYDLFREYYTKQQREVHLDFEKKLYYNKSLFAENLPYLIQMNYREVFKERIVELGFKKAFKGNWGAESHTKRVGIVQDLNRLSFNSMIAHLRKTNLPLDSSSKLVGPRVLHCSQWGFIDPIDTPDGGSIGLHKSLAISTVVSRGYSREPMIKWLREKVAMKLVEECGPALLSTMTKVIVNGFWCGSVSNPFETVDKIRLFRRNALIPIYTSATFEIKLNTVFIYTDAGRVCRPLFYKEQNRFSFDKPEVLRKIKAGEFNWSDLTTGFNKKLVENPEKEIPRIFELEELYSGVNQESNPAKMEKFIKEKAIIDYIDPSESENALIAVNIETYEKETQQKFTHLEIHESLIFGVMCNQIIFPENNPPTRNSFSCGQSKQAVSMYHTNFQNRMDKTAVVLNYGQTPLVKSRYLDYINHEENPYGENAIVAIMCYTGYNVEDAVLINEGALKRGLFSTTYYTMYESHEENSKNANSVVDKRFTNTETLTNLIGTKPGYDYSQLDKYGLIKENTEVNDKMVLIGLTSNNLENPDVRLDESKTPKKGQLGVIDKTFITEGEEGDRIAKVRIREIRSPAMGDKMASRSGQKGTVGLIVPEADMPFTKDGMRPDIIINPHAIPSRMTIGQLVECITGKACAVYGGFGDCTAFNNKGSKVGMYGEFLCKNGFHSSGNEIMYNGMTGDQLESEIYIGPTYYMRLKHMVKDKINFRALGPRTALTKQPVSGRANDGGLRIGEMERDVLISHGINSFLTESMMIRGDKYFMAVCNQTGMLAIYNPSKNIFLSPMADGPIKFNGTVDGKTMNIENISKYGRSFSVVSVPYSFKLLLQELQSINIGMRIITEDNIEQIENMSFSKNIDYLSHEKDLDLAVLVKKMRRKVVDIRQKISRPNDDISLEPFAEEAVVEREPESPAYAPGSPAYAPGEWEGESPPYAPGSPAYVPPFGEGESPPYAPGSSAYVPLPEGESPAYVIPEEEKQEGGLKNGDIVFYRGGDSKPNRQWYIKDDSGDGQFYTIETNDWEGLNNVGDSVRVVLPMDIYKPSDVVYPSSSSFPTQMGQEYMQFQQNQNQPGYYEGQGFGQGYGQRNHGFSNGNVPEINVNPVIKIVNGPDNSIDTGNGSQGQGQGQGQMSMPMPIMQTPQKENGIFMSDLMAGNQVEERKKEKIVKRDDGEIDFNNFVIKKI